MIQMIQNRNRLRLTKQTYGFQRGRDGGGINEEFETDIHSLLHITWITKDLLYNAGNSTQDSIVTYMGKNLQNRYICISK